MDFKVPTVTTDDLRKFHAEHFPNTPLPEKYVHDTEAEASEEYYEYADEDDLGYYEDGVKRTLTDEQIAMFRHTEIQTILRERRGKREEAELTDQELSQLPEAAAPTVALSVDPVSPTSSPSRRSTPMSISSEENKEQNGSVDTPKQQWLAVGAKSRARNAKNRKKNRKNHRARKKAERERQERELEEGEESDEWSPWNQANGPDAQKDSTIDLDY